MGKSVAKKSTSKAAAAKGKSAKAATIKKGPAARTPARATTPAKSGKSSGKPSAPPAKSGKPAAKGTTKDQSITDAKSAKPAGKGVPTAPADSGGRRQAAEPSGQAAGRASPKQNSAPVAGRPQDANARPPRPAADLIAPVHVPAAVPQAAGGEGKPKKNQAGLGAKELEHFRDLLLEKRRELVGDMSSMEREALRQGGGSNLSTLPIHMADMGTDNYEQEFTLGLVEKDRNLLREINRALAKIQEGAYGICEGTGQPIARPRLEAQPWARFGIEYARTQEKPVMRR